MLHSVANLFSLDGRVGQVLVGLLILLVLGGIAYAVYRFGFAGRVRAPGATRGRAPRLGVVDVFGLDGQRQLVIVRRDNIEHLLMIGGPNDLVIESQILRTPANGRDAAKPQPAAPAEPLVEPAPPPPAAAPRPSAPAAAPPRRLPPRPAPEHVAPPPPPVVAVSPAEPVSAAPVVTAEPAPAPEPPPPPPPRPAPPPPRVEILPPKPPAEPAPPPQLRPAEVAAEPAPRPAIEIPPRRPPPPPLAAKLTPAPAAASASPRPNLPSPITPLRARLGPEPGSLLEPKPVAEIPAPKPVEKVIVPPPPPPAPPPPAAPAEKQAPAARKEETFYDLESLEAEMARLLGREP